MKESSTGFTVIYYNSSLLLPCTGQSALLDVGVDLKLCGKEFERVLGITPGDWLLLDHDTFKQLLQAQVIYMVRRTKVSFCASSTAADPQQTDGDGGGAGSRCKKTMARQVLYSIHSRRSIQLKGPVQDEACKEIIALVR